MKKEILDISMNVFSLIAMTVAVILYLGDAVDHAIYLMCLAIYLKE